MRWGWFAAFLVVVAAASANAVIIGTPSMAADGDGAVVCDPSQWDSGTNTLSVGEYVYSTPGHVQGAINTDGDPTVLIAKYVNNYTTSTWSAYRFDIYMDQLFSIGSILTPVGWNDIVTPVAGGGFFDTDNRPWAYKGTVDFTATGPGFYLAPNALAMFGANVTFGQNVQFEVQQIGFVPEPVSLALLALGGLFLRRRS